MSVLAKGLSMNIFPKRFNADCTITHSATQHTLTAAKPDKLLMDQQQAFDIVSQHLWKSLHNEDPPQFDAV